jgi:hypothetical protein
MNQNYFSLFAPFSEQPSSGQFLSKPGEQQPGTIGFAWQFVLLFLLSVGLANAQVSLGTGSTTTTSFPIVSNYGYNYSQQIYLKSEINASGMITSLTFTPTTTSITPTNFATSKDWVIYMGHTDKVVFSSLSDWVLPEELVQVFDGEVSYPASLPGSITITLDEPFEYNNIDNLVIAIDENTPSYGTLANWSATAYGTAANYRGMVYRNDSNNPDAASPPAASTRSNIISDVILGGIQQACAAPTGIVKSQIRFDGALISWTASVSVAATSYSVYISTVNTAPGESTEPTETVENETSVAVSSLTPDTVYYVWVRSECGNEGESTWIPGGSFRTLCAPIATPYINTFTPYPGTCWTVNNNGTPATGPTGTATSGWRQDGFIFPATTGAASFNLYGNSSVDNHWLISPLVDLGSDAAQRLKYDIAFREYDEAIAGAIATDVISVLITDDFGATWNVLETYDADNIPPANGMTEIKSLADYSGVVQFAFHMFDDMNPITEQDSEVFIDNFIVEPIPSCDTPSALAASAVTSDSATLNWTAPETAPTNGYEFYYSTENIAPDFDGTAAAEATADITGLDANTTYYAWVRSVCDGGDSSAWIALPSFKTACLAEAVPYVMPLNDAVVPALPDCVTVQNVNGDAKTWETVASTANITGKVMRYPYNGSMAANDWFFTNGLELEAGVSYRVKFKYKDTSYAEKLRVSIGQSAVNTAMTQELFSVTTGTSGLVVPKNIDFTVEEDGVYYIGFQAFSDMDMNSLYVGEISVILTPSEVVDWGNLQAIVVNDAAVSTMQTCQSATVYAQAWEPELTEQEGASAGLVVWIGMNTEDTDPATWAESKFSLATFNVDSGNNDEFQKVYSNLAPGTYYFASRFQLNEGPFRYGATNNGFWGDSNPNAVLTVTIPEPIEASVNVDSVCAGTEVTLSVSSEGTDYTYVWTPGDMEGASVTTTPESNTTYTVTGTNTNTGCVVTSTVSVTVNNYPEQLQIVAANNACQDSVTPVYTTGGVVAVSETIGTGVSTTTPTGFTNAVAPNPFHAYYGGAKQQWIYRAEELAELGMVAGTHISSLTLYLANAGPTPLQNFTVRMKNSNKLQFSAANNWETDMQTVRAAVSLVPVAGANVLELDEPFMWDGQSSIIVETIYSNNNGGVTAGVNTAKYSPTDFASTLFYRVDSNTAAQVTNYSGNATYMVNHRNDVTFGFNVNSTITWSPADLLYTNAEGTVPYVAGTPAEVVWAKLIETSTITATATSPASCAISANKTISVSNTPAPELVSGEAVELCGTAFAEDLNPFVTGSGIQWYFNNQLLSTDTVLVPGVYSATQTVNGCEGPATDILVSILAGTDPGFADVSICNDIDYALNAISPNGITGTWSPAIVDTTTSGAYVFTPNAGQCSSIQTIIVTIVPSVVADFNTVASMCYGAPAFELPMTAPNGVTGTWSPAVVSNTQSAAYVFTPDAQMCGVPHTLTVTVFEEVPGPDAEDIQYFTLGQTIQDLVVFGSGTYNWYDAATGGNLLDPFTPLQQGATYYVSQFVDNCESVARLAITADIDLGISGPEKMKLTYYPNPVQDVLVIENTSDIDFVTISNMVGQTVYNAKSAGTQLRADLSGFAAGTYIVNVTSNGLVKNFKVVKK